jgi:hypothetical protein
MSKRYVYVIEDRQLNDTTNHFEPNRISVASSVKVARKSIRETIKINSSQYGGELVIDSDSDTLELFFKTDERTLYICEYFWITESGRKVEHRIFLQKYDLICW